MSVHTKIPRPQARSESPAPSSPAPAPPVAVGDQADGRAEVERADRFGHHLDKLEVSDRGGLPGHLRTGLEKLSGLDLGGVRVHYGSAKPAQLQALAYAQGNDIHLAPGQEQHLPHEAWHVVQQKRGRVRPTLRLGGVEINDDPGLEKEASDMGSRAAAMKIEATPPAPDRDSEPVQGVVQGWFKIGDQEYRSRAALEKEEFKPIQGVNMEKVIARLGDWAEAEDDKGKPDETWEDLITRAAAEVAPEQSVKPEADEYLSDYPPSEDDERTTLTAQEKLAILRKRGSKKRKRLGKLDLGDADQIQDVSDPHARKIFSARRAAGSLGDAKTAIGKQQFRIGLGKGHFLQAGGNKEDRPENVKEPPSSYGDILPAIMSFGKKDSEADSIFKALTSEDRATGTEFSDAETARLLYHYAQNDVKEIEKKLEDEKIGRTPLTEHLSKLTAITGLSEQARGFEADPPYDASLFIKHGLAVVAKGERSMNEMFYRGHKGGESIFLGAPTDGGADQLRDPLKHPEALERQMSIFPHNKGEFKKSLNELKTKTQSTFPALTPEKAEQQAKRAADIEVEKAEMLKRQIEALKPPDGFYDLMNFMGTILEKWGNKITHAKGRLKSERAQNVLDEALILISQKNSEAEARLPTGPRKRQKRS